MRFFFFIILTVCWFNFNKEVLIAQPLQLQWAQNTVGVYDSLDLFFNDEDRIWGLTIDSDRNIVLAGQFASEAFSIGDTTLVNAGPYSQFNGSDTLFIGSTDAFIAKISNNGDLLWGQRFGGTNSDFAREPATDPFDNIAVIGSFSDTATFGNITLGSQGEYGNEYLAKLSDAGTVLWVNQFSAPMLDGITFHAIKANSSGEIVVTGNFNGTVNFGDSSLTSVGLYEDFFLAKYSQDGDLTWLRHGACSESAKGEVVLVDGADHIWVSGYFSGTVDFDDTTLVSMGDEDIFLIKYSSDGDILVSRREGGSVDEEEPSIALDPSGNIFLAGQWEDDTTNIGGTILVSAGDEDIFVAKYNLFGEFQWVRQAGGESLDDRPKIATDAFGNVYVTGRAEETPAFGDTVLSGIDDEDGFLAIYNPDGELVWIQREPQDGELIHIDRTNSVILSGVFSDTLVYGNKPLVNKERTSIFLVKYSSTITSVEEHKNTATSFTLRQNYPNPFNSATTIAYTINKPVTVELAVYNLLGQKVATLVKKMQRAGEYTVRWQGIDDSGRQVSSGLYLYRLRTGEFVQASKMLLLK